MRFAPLALLAVVWLGTCASAASPPREVSVVVWHAFPDPAAGTPRADPLSSADAPAWANGSRLPVTLVDHVSEASDAPLGDPSSVAAHLEEMRRLVAQRASGPTVTIELSGVLETDGVLRVSVVTNGSARAVVVEDGVEVAGDSGVASHRFVARASMRANGSSFEARVLPEWDGSRLGVVAWVDGPEGDALQTAYWRLGDAPTHQTSKAVLLEHATASWCAPCAASDDALSLLATQSGLPLASPPRGSYAVAATPWGLGGLAAGAVVGILLLRGSRS